eukprot:scaffold294_cov221-Amphora_coffeaeformis.AAC.59
MTPSQHDSLVGIILDKTRVRDAAGYRGTVTYVGSVASASDASQIYAGIIWDDPERGKHNGTVVSKATGQLVSHFTCPSPTGASFVKVSKLDVGTTLTPDVLQERYVSLDSNELVAPDNKLPHTAATASGKNDKPIEFLGELKIRKYQQVPDLETLSLRLLGLSSVNVMADWSRAEHVQTLDLAGNLFSDWTILGHVLACFPSLKTLSLASNRIGDLGSDEIPKPEQREPLLQSLNVRDCHIRSVQTLLSLGRALPKLQEIGMGQAKLTDMQISQQVDLAEALPHLKVLDLSEGQLELHHVEGLATLPALESLSLDDNPIEQWPATTEDSFPRLTHLQLAGTQISTWSDLEGLRNCRQFQSLRLRSTPLTERVGTAAVRSQLIARFPSLTVLNASLVSQVEREEAERRYVANITRQLQKASTEQDKEAILADHPAYTRLSKDHATILESILQGETNGRNGSTNNSWSDSLSTVTIRSMAAQSCEQPPLIRRLPVTLTVGKVKALLARHFGLDWDLQELSLQNKNQKESALPIALDEDDQTLAYFGVADGATIYMHEVDVRARQEAQQQQQRAQEEKLKRQENEVQEYMAIQKKLAGA